MITIACKEALSTLRNYVWGVSLLLLVAHVFIVLQISSLMAMGGTILVSIAGPIGIGLTIWMALSQLRTIELSLEART